MSQIYNTYKSFRDYLGYDGPLSYVEWLGTNDDDKAAILYVQFFREIYIAWTKTRSPYIEEEDAVEVILQYLLKNVPLIQKDSVRFDPKYIYRTIFNCLFCRCNNVIRERDKYLLEQSNIARGPEGEFDLFDIIADSDAEVDGTESERFWKLIEDQGQDTLTVVIKLLGGQVDKIPVAVKNDRGRTEIHLKSAYYQIPKGRRDEIVKDLPYILEEFKETFYV